jgi:hypothetical protein
MQPALKEWHARLPPTRISRSPTPIMSMCPNPVLKFSAFVCRVCLSLDWPRLWETEAASKFDLCMSQRQQIPNIQAAREFLMRKPPNANLSNFFLNFTTPRSYLKLISGILQFLFKVGKTLYPPLISIGFASYRVFVGSCTLGAVVLPVLLKKPLLLSFSQPLVGTSNHSYSYFRLFRGPIGGTTPIGLTCGGCTPLRSRLDFE